MTSTAIEKHGDAGGQIDFRGGTSKTIAAARKILEQTHVKICNHEVARNKIRQDNVEKYKDLHNKLYQKIQTTIRLQKPLEERLHGCKSALIATKGSLKLLRDSSIAYNIRRKGIAEIKQGKADILAKSGLGGNVKDPSAAALDEEAIVLEKAGAKASEHMTHTKGMIQNLEQVIQLLESDVENKKHSLIIDQECMSTTHPTWPLPVGPPKPVPLANLNGVLRSPPSSRGTPKRRSRNPVYSFSGPGGGSHRPPVPHDWRTERPPIQIPFIDNTDDTDGDLDSTRLALPAPTEYSGAAHLNSYQEITYQQESLKLVNRAKNAEMTAVAMVKANKTLLKHIYEDCQNASGFAEVAMAKRIQHTQGECKKLEATIEETEQVLEKMKHCKAITAEHLESHEEPSRLAEHKAQRRQQKTERERIGDPVTTALTVHAHTLVENRQHLERVQAAEDDHIQQLLQAKTVCEADLQHKRTVLDIEKQSLEHMNQVVTRIQEEVNRISSSSEDATTAAPQQG